MCHKVQPQQDMLQKKTDEIFNHMPNGTVDDILIAGFYEQGKDHNETLDKVLWVCRQEILKCNKDKCVFSDVPAFPSLADISQGVSKTGSKESSRT